MTLATCLSDFYQETAILKDPCLNSITSSINHLDSVLPDLEDTEIDIQRHMGLDNFNLYTSDLEKALRSHKKSLVDALIGYVRKEFPEVIFNKNMLTRFAFHMKPFDAETFLSFIRKTYADQDLFILKQWQYAILTEMTNGSYVNDHWRTWKEKTPEDIPDINSAGIDLHCRGREFYPGTLANYVVKFCQFVFGERKPLSEYKGLEDIKSEYNLESLENGKSYSTKELKSIRYYNGNNSLKIGFKSPSDRQKFKSLLLTPAWVTLGRSEPLKEPCTDACDICLYKDVLCMYCKDYSAWAGSCQFCTHRKEYNGYRSHECEECSQGARDNFIPVEEVRNVSGLVKEDGYGKHTWKAKNFVEPRYLKVHCFEPLYRYRNYNNHQYRPPLCLYCKNSITEKVGEKIKQVCLSNSFEKKYFVWNCRGTLATKT